MLNYGQHPVHFLSLQLTLMCLLQLIPLTTSGLALSAPRIAYSAHGKGRQPMLTQGHWMSAMMQISC